MSNNADDNSDGSANAEHNAGGKGKPPLHSRFPPGVSGNPSGRPKKKPSTDDLLRQELAREIQVTINGSKQTMSMHAALVASAVDKALKGTLKEKIALLKLSTGLGEPKDSSLVDENGVLKVRINLGESPSMRERSKMREAEDADDSDSAIG